MKNNHTPEIRFKEFTRKWEQRKIGEFVQDYVEKTTVQNQYPVLTSSQKRGIIHQEDYFADRQVTTQNNIGYFVLPRGYFTFRSRSDNGIFKFNRNDIIDKGIISYFYPVFKISNGNSDFFLNLLNSTIKKQVALEAEGTGQRVLSLKKFKNINVIIPEIQEQERIGIFLKQLNDTITLQQQELTSLQQIKQGFLQKMFPKEGESVPEVRFPGFTRNWEQRKLGEIVEITMGQSPNGENYTENPDDHILVQGNADMKNGWVAPRVWTTQVTKIAEKGDIILSVRAPVGDVGKTQYDVVLGRGVAGIKGNEFIFQSLIKMKSNGFWTRYSTGSTFESINSNDLKEAIISLPEEAEQTEIGNFLKQLDETIALYQLELDALKKTKKAFLQKMFVSQ